MTPHDFRQRTKAFAIRVIRLVEALPKSMVDNVIGRQLVRCGTSVGANYRAACRAKSPADFIAKMRIVEEECDECLYWMELLIETGKVDLSALESLMREADAILSMVVASIKTARSRKASVPKSPKSPISNLQSPIDNPQSPIDNLQSPLTERIEV